MLKRTPLNRVHREMGAKMVDFGGWEMPLHYGSQIEEHHRVRRAAGMFDVSHMLAVDISGAAARDFLRRLLANDVDKLKAPGKALYSCLLSERGGVLDDLIVYRLGEDRYRAVVNAGTTDKDLAWLGRQGERLAPELEITPRRDLALIAVQGPQARDKVWRALPAVRAASEALQPFYGVEQGQYFVARTGYTGEDGFEIMLPAAEAEALWRGLHAAGVAPAGLGARDTLRLEAGMNLYGQDMDEDTTPLESGLAWTVALGPGRDFIGRAALESAPPTRRLLGLILLDKGVLRGHQKVMTPDGEGEITSGGFSPTLERSIALARLPAAAAPGQTVRVRVRDKLLAARVVQYPFVRNGAPCYREG